MKTMFLPLLLAVTPAPAATFQDGPALDRAVAAFTGRAIGEDGGARTPVDPRLRLAQCPMVSLSWRTSAHDAVVANCTGPIWRIYVPVRMAAGAIATPVAAPAAMTAPIKAEPVIRRNDPIVIEAGSAGFSISSEGVSMGDAAPGGRFMARVAGGKAPVQVVAVEAGRATLPGWQE